MDAQYTRIATLTHTITSGNYPHISLHRKCSKKKEKEKKKHPPGLADENVDSFEFSAEGGGSSFLNPSYRKAGQSGRENAHTAKQAPGEYLLAYSWASTQEYKLKTYGQDMLKHWSDVRDI